MSGSFGENIRQLFPVKIPQKQYGRVKAKKKQRDR